MDLVTVVVAESRVSTCVAAVTMGFWLQDICAYHVGKPTLTLLQKHRAPGQTSRPPSLGPLGQDSLTFPNIIKDNALTKRRSRQVYVRGFWINQIASGTSNQVEARLATFEWGSQRGHQDGPSHEQPIVPSSRPFRSAQSHRRVPRRKCEGSKWSVEGCAIEFGDAADGMQCDGKLGRARTT